MNIVSENSVKRTAIITAARNLFEHQGFEKTTISQICRNLKIAKGLFYYYFTSKEEVLHEVVSEILGEIHARGDKILNNDQLDFCNKIAAYIDTFYAEITHHLSNVHTPGLQEPYLKAIITLGCSQIQETHIKTLTEIGIKEGYLQFEYPEYMMMIVIRGILSLGENTILDKKTAIKLIEQSLQLPLNSLQSLN